jgi:hypothetical protein
VPRTKWWKLKEEAAKMFKERVLKEDPWHERGDAIACGWRCPHAFEKWLQKNSEWPKEANVKLKRHGDGMRMCKMLLRRRNSALGVCT